MIFIQSLSEVQLYRIQGGSIYYPPLLNNFNLKKVFLIFRTPISLNRRNCGWVGGALISKCVDPTGFKLSTWLLIECSHLPQVWLLGLSLYSSQLVYLLLVQILKHYVTLFIYNVGLQFFCIVPEKPHGRSHYQLRFFFESYLSCLNSTWKGSCLDPNQADCVVFLGETFLISLEEPAFLMTLRRVQEL